MLSQAPITEDNAGMTKFYTAKLQTTDAKADKERRYRNIVLASGKLLETGEIRDIEHLYVMGTDGKLIQVSKLGKDPEKQTEEYTVYFAENHGHYDPVTGERVVEMEDIIGDAKVWFEPDGVHARVYFANNDPKADHNWAVSDNASYSMGADWEPDGYYGADNNIDEPIGILREISIVPTGNDPRAKTIDTKQATSKAQGGAKADGENLTKKGTNMPKQLDALTPDERDAMGKELMGVIDKFTTDVPESQTEPTARDSKDEAAEAPEETTDAPKEEESTTDGKRTLHNPNIFIMDRKPIHQAYTSTDGADWRFSKEAKRKFADALHSNGGVRGNFAADWAKELRSHGATTNDGITGLGLPVDTRSLIIDAIEKSEGLISHFDELGGKSYLIRLITDEEDVNSEFSRAHGFKKGDEKIFEKLLNTPRTIYNKMVYKMLDLDTMEIYENPELIDVRARELVQKLIIEVERAAVIGDGRTAPTGNNPDYRMFDGTRGFYSMLADAQATEGYGQLMAASISMPAGSNLYDASIEAESEIESEGGLIYVTKKALVKNLRLAKKSSTSNEPLFEPGTKIEDLLGAERIYTPTWMQNAPVDVIVFANKSYGLIGKSNPDMRPEFNAVKNQDILLAEFPRGGSLKAYKSAVAITFATAAASKD